MCSVVLGKILVLYYDPCKINTDYLAFTLARRITKRAQNLLFSTNLKNFVFPYNTDFYL